MFGNVFDIKKKTKAKTPRKKAKAKTTKKQTAYQKRVKKGIVYGGKKLSLDQWATAEGLRQQYGRGSSQFKKYMKKVKQNKKKGR